MTHRDPLSLKRYRQPSPRWPWVVAAALLLLALLGRALRG